MELFYVDGNLRIGPIGKSQFQSLIQAKKLNAKTLVWQPGMTQWEELGTFIGRRVPDSGSMESLADTMQFAVCCECEEIHNQRDLIHIQNYWVCGSCKSVFLQKIKEGVQPRNRVIYANYGSLEKGLQGDYELSIFDILSEGWRLTDGSKLVIIGSLFLVWIISGLIQNILFLPLPILMGLVGVVIEQNFGAFNSETFAIVLAGLMFIGFIILMFLSMMAQAPLWAGLEMIGVRRSVDLPISFRYVFEYFKQFLPLALTTLIVMLFATIGFVLLIIPGIYIVVASFLAMQLVADKKMGPWSAFKASVRAITHKWFHVFSLFFILFGILAISTIPCGVGLIWAWPLFINTKGVLYRNIFGVDQVV